MNKDFLAAARPARVTELIALYSAADRHGLVSDTVAPTVVVVEPPPESGLAAGLTDRLRPFGVSVVRLDAADLDDHRPAARRSAFLLGGPLHGWCVESDSAARECDLVSEAVTAARMGQWAAAARTGPTFTRTHPPGSDSTGVVQFNAGTEIVAKIGEASAIQAETAFIARANDDLTRIGRDPLFPRLHGVHIEGGQGVSLMEAADAADLGERLFTDAAKTRLSPDAADVLAPYLDQLGNWYVLTAGPEQPTNADYLYRERFHALRDQPAFRSTFHRFFPGLDLDATLGAELVLPGGQAIPGYSAASRWLDRHAPHLLPDGGSRVHGDIYPTNMLRRTGGGPVFIDPRTIWEGRRRRDPGYGDPVFDLATLLHGLFPMMAILEAVKRERSRALFGDALDLEQPHDLSSLRLPTRLSEELRAMERHLVALAPGAGASVRCRLSIGAACSLAGWLKYERSLRTPYAWLATYAYTLWYLDRARSEYEQHLAEEAE